MKFKQVNIQSLNSCGMRLVIVELMTDEGNSVAVEIAELSALTFNAAVSQPKG